MRSYKDEREKGGPKGTRTASGPVSSGMGLPDNCPGASEQDMSTAQEAVAQPCECT